MSADAQVSTSPTVKVPILPLFLCIVVAALVAVGGSAGAFWFLAKSGRLPGQGETGAAGAAAPKPAAPKAAPVTHAVVLDSLLANLADADAHAYLKLGMTVDVVDDPAATKEKEKKEAKGPSPEETALRDSTLEVLGHEQSATLLAPEGKEALKLDLQKKFATSNPTIKVAEVYFTEFLVQR